MTSVLILCPNCAHFGANSTRKSLLNSESILDLLRLMSSSGILSSVPDLTTACALFTVLPVTVSSAERFFAKLKILKMYLKSAISQESLDGLALLAIENETTKQLNTDNLLDSFANNKARRM